MARPSLTSQPAASSKSWPGVRIVTQARRAANDSGAHADLERFLGDQAVLAWGLAPVVCSTTRVRTDGPGRRARSLITGRP